jgi:hypothetical protein
VSLAARLVLAGGVWLRWLVGDWLHLRTFQHAAAGAKLTGARIAALRAPGPRYFEGSSLLPRFIFQHAAAGAKLTGAKIAAVRAPEPRYFSVEESRPSQGSTRIAVVKGWGNKV